MLQQVQTIQRQLCFLVLGLLSAGLIAACQGGSTSQSVQSQPLSDCHLSEHALGQVCVPANPQAVISLEETTFADAIALGITPIGTATYEDVSIDYLSSYSSQTKLVGRSEEPNLEEILSLKPDLIVGLEYAGEFTFEPLSQIAPTALGEWKGYSSWREHFDFVARILGKENAAEEVWADYSQRISELKAALDNQLTNKKVTSLYSYAGGMTIDAENSFIGSILSDLGIRQPDYPATEDGTIALSEELLPTIDADILFFSIYDEASKQTLANWEKKPLWQQLKAVQSNQVYVVDADIWRAGNPIAANLIIDDLFKHLIDK